jgi:hypothetical protein
MKMNIRPFAATGTDCALIDDEHGMCNHPQCCTNKKDVFVAELQDGNKVFFLVMKSFSDVYGQSYNPTNYTGSEYTQTLTTNDNNVYVRYCYVSYSSIVNNTANGGWGCMAHSTSCSSDCIDACNIINNTQLTTSDFQIVINI